MRVLVVLMLVFVSAAPVARSTTRPVRGQPVRDPLVDEAVAAVRNDALPALAGRVEPELAKAMGELKKPDLANIARLGTLREFGRYFGRLKELDEPKRQTLAWLIQNRELAANLMLAATEFDPPDRVLEVLRALREAHKDKVAQHPELAAALALVWDEPGKGGGGENAKTDVRTPARMFGYFSRARLRWDPRALPVEVLGFVADSNLSDEELEFVQGRYASTASPGTAYFDLPYDEGAYYDLTGKDAERARTLPNILRRGGSAVDQAYYASQVGKALGVPTVPVRGTGVESGAAPVWIAFLKSAGGGSTWDSDSGRRDDHDGWPGEAVDPRTGEILSDGDLAMIAELEGTRAAERLASAALVRSVDAASAEKQFGVLVKAIELSPGNRLAWERLAETASNQKLAAPQQKQVDELYRRMLARRVPGYALSWRLRMIKGKSVQERIAALKKIGEEFRPSPQLFAAARVELGDLLAAEKRTDEALAAFEDALMRGPDAGPITVLVMGRIDPLMHKTGELARLAAIYSKAFGMTERIRPSSWARTTPYFIVGDRYAYVLEELKDENRALGVRAQLTAVVLGGQGPGIGPGAR